jgi:hypothetical protein
MRIPRLAPALCLAALARGPAAPAQSYSLRNRDTDPAAVYQVKVFDRGRPSPTVAFELAPGKVHTWSRTGIHRFEVAVKGHPGTSRTFMIKDIPGCPPVRDYQIISNWNFELSNKEGLRTDRDWH